MLYPNPAQHFFVVAGLEAGTCAATLTDLSGKTVMTASLNATHNLVDVSALTSGIFFVTLEQQNTRTIKKLVVH